MANGNYTINADIKFRLNSSSTKPVVDSLTKQLGAKGINLPVNLQFKSMNVQDVTRQNAAFRTLTRTITALGTSSSKSASQLNSLYNSIRHVGSSLNNFGSARGLQTFNNNVNRSTKTLQQMGQSANKIRHDFVGFSESVGISARRFLSFGLAAAVLAKTSYEIRNATIAALEFDREMVRLRQVSKDSDTIIGSVARTISKLGIEMGVSSGEMAKTAVTLRQAGLSARETQKALEVLGKTTLSPTFEDLHSTTEGLIALFNQFDKNIYNLENHFSAISKVSADFAVESSDLVEALKRTGGAFKAAGGDVNELLAMYTTIRQTTRESAESIATGMRTIISRLQDPVIARKLHDIGVEVYNLKGDFVGPYEAVERLGAALRKLPQGDIRASQILKDIGGLRQLSRVIPLIYNNDITTQALQSAKNSVGTLDEDAKMAQKAIIVQLDRIKEGFLDLFRVISTDSSVRAALTGMASLIEGIAEALRQVKPLIPVLLAFGAIKTIGAVAGGYRSFTKGLIAPGKGYADGGYVSGGIAGKDSVPARLMPGEFVMSKPAVDRIGKTNIEHIHTMAKGGIIPRNERYARSKLANILKTNPEHRKEIYGEIKDSKYIAHGIEAIAFRHSNGNVIRIGSNKVVRPKDNLTLQPFRSQIMGDRTVEELPYAPPLSQTVKNISSPSNNSTVGSGLFGDVEFAPDDRISRITRAFSKRVIKKGYGAWDAHRNNLARYKGKIVAIDPDVYRPLKDLYGVAPPSKQSVDIKAYADGGTVGVSLSGLKPRGTDTVPAMLTPGEYVIPRDAAETFGYDNLDRIRKKQFRMNRRLRKFGDESLYDYSSVADQLHHTQVAHTARQYRIMGNHLLYKSPNYLKQNTISHKRHLRNIINEHRLKYAGKAVTPWTLENASFVLGLRTTGAGKTMVRPTTMMASGGDVTQTHVYMAEGGEVPDRKRIKLAKKRETGDIPIGGANIGLPKRGRGYSIGASRANSNFSFGHAINPNTTESDPIAPTGIISNFGTLPSSEPRIQRETVFSQNREDESQDYYAAIDMQKRIKQRMERERQHNITVKPTKDISPVPDKGAQAVREYISSFNKKPTRNRIGANYRLNNERISYPEGTQIHLPSLTGPPQIGTFSKTDRLEARQTSLEKTRQREATRQTIKKNVQSALFEPQHSEQAYSEGDKLLGYARTEKAGQGAARDVGNRQVRHSLRIQEIQKEYGNVTFDINNLDKATENRFFPTFQKWIRNLKKNTKKTQQEVQGFSLPQRGTEHPEVKAIRQQNRSFAISGTAFAAGMIAPMATNAIFGTADKPGYGGIKGAQAGNMIGGALMGAGETAALVAQTPIGRNPYALGGAAIVGAGIGAYGANRQFKQDLSTKNIQDMEDKLSKVNFSNRTGGFASDNDKDMFSEGINTLIPYHVSQEVQGNKLGYAGSIADSYQSGGLGGALSTGLGYHLFGTGTLNPATGQNLVSGLDDERKKALSDRTYALYKQVAEKNPTLSHQEYLDKSMKALRKQIWYNCYTSFGRQC